MRNRFMRDPGKTPERGQGDSEPSARPLADPDKKSSEGPAPGHDLIEAKMRLHRKLIDDLNLASLERMSREDLRRQIGEFVAE